MENIESIQLALSGLNKHDRVYHGLTYSILTSPRINFRAAERAVVDTIGIFGAQVEYDLSDETIPLSNTKKIAYKSQLFPEIVGFLRNENNLKWYLEQGMKIWTANAFNFYRQQLQEDDSNYVWKNLKKDSVEFNSALSEFEQLVLSGKDSRAGNLGEFYPRQWRSFRSTKPNSEPLEMIMVDQIANAVEKLKNNPTTRYAVITAWNPVDVINNNAALAPCHCLFQAYRRTDINGVERLDVKMFQRSADHYLGVAFNAPQYAALTSIMAKIIDVKPGVFIHSFGDLHIYVGHSGSARSNWYKNPENIIWLQEELKKNNPKDVLENLLTKLPGEGENSGYDHVPYAIKQLGIKSNSEPARLIVNITNKTSLENLNVNDLIVQGYQSPDVITINGIKSKMAS